MEKKLSPKRDVNSIVLMYESEQVHARIQVDTWFIHKLLVTINEIFKL